MSIRRLDRLLSPASVAVFCAPAHTVAGLVGEPGALGTRAVVIMTAGRVRWYMPDPS